MLAVPLSDQGEASGWIAYLDDAQLRQHKPNAAAHLLEIAAAAAIPARNARRHADALELTLRDPLTGLYNRRAYEAFLEREEQRARRGGQPLSLILIDLDYFKSLNDTYGHPLGDRALLLLSQVLVDTVRRSDIVARPGGDEFAVVLPEIGAAGAARIASRIRRRLVETPLTCGRGIEPIQLSISCGIADLDNARGEAEAMIHLADKALYEAKRSGRNQVLRATRE
ncbi:MAG: GGDEF domain-containing protein [Acidobacteriota bacterium]